MIELDPEEKLKRIYRLMEHTKEEIATQWVTLGTDMKEKYDKLMIEFIEYSPLSVYLKSSSSAPRPAKMIAIFIRNDALSIVCKANLE
jgi:hypothetical protein